MFGDREGAEALVVELGARVGGLDVSANEPYFVARSESIFLSCLVGLCFVALLSSLEFEVEVFVGVAEAGSKILRSRVCLGGWDLDAELWLETVVCKEGGLLGG